MIMQIFVGHILEEFAFDLKWAPCQGYLNLAVLPQFLNIGFK